MGGEKNGWRVGNKKILGGMAGRRHTSYLDIIETPAILLTIEFFQSLYGVLRGFLRFFHAHK
jgi:hypothetical protein